MLGSDKKKRIIVESGTLQTSEKASDVNEFKCYANSFVSNSFPLPIRKICPSACNSVPGIKNTYLITEIIENTNDSGDLSNHYLDGTVKIY